MHQFKYLPWPMLSQTALITLGLATGMDYGLTLILPPASQDQILSLFGPPFGLLFSSVVDMVLGIVGVLVLEKLMGPRSSIYLATLWGLILCLLLALILRSFIPIPGLLLSQSHQISIVGVLVGVFVKSQRYWR
ncbi:hypothetical protein [Acaryochloris sp. IP29b_bin.148]|uniref:hypothetical protein n=1 Tax=Acaryochloris sp. IP29b_bin.148 TaxID=2969218 RepID=UPI00261EFCCB|nr:hypothetical protein [Acaryochloris sp. IP29b_bin.148]